VLVVVVPLMSVQSAWASPSPSPSPGAVTCTLVGRRSRQPQPLRRLQSSCYEIWALNYSYLFGTGEQNSRYSIWPASSHAAERWYRRRRQDLDIHIKSGVKWQDGVPLTASDVSFTYNYIIKNSLVNYSTT